MQILLPSLTGPLEAVSACGTLSFETYPDLKRHFPEKDTEYATTLDDGDDPRLLRLLLGPSHRENAGHVHLDCVRRRAFSKTPVTISSLEEIQTKCDFLEGSSLRFEYNSRFVISPSDVPTKSTVTLLAGIEMNLDGFGASVTRATVRVTDPLKTEVRWKTFRRKEVKQFSIEIFQSSELAFSDQILNRTEQRAMEAFERFVLGRRQSEKEVAQ